MLSSRAAVGFMQLRECGCINDPRKVCGSWVTFSTLALAGLAAKRRRQQNMMAQMETSRIEIDGSTREIAGKVELAILSLYTICTLQHVRKDQSKVPVWV